jgi:peptidoglycan-associated lipoprotein
MLKRGLLLFIMMICVSVMLVTGCAKKTVKKAVITGEETPTAEQQVPLGGQAEKEKAAAMESQALKEQAAREPALQEQAAREQGLQEQAAKEMAPTPKEEVTLEDIHFDFDKFNLIPEARKILDKHAAWLLKHKDYKVIIEGHCDERGTTEYNLALGERRAAAAAKYLVSLGVEETRIETISYGKERPLDPGRNEDAWAKNRRAHFFVISKKAAL